MPAFVVGGLGYGDEGKGATVDFLTRKYKIDNIIRYNGGPQTAHNVVLPDGRHHTFSQFGSGLLARKCYTYLSKYMLVNPLNLFAEAKNLENLGVSDPLRTIIIDPKCPIITPFHKAINKLTEWSRSNAKHGSCGQGVGETRRQLLTYGQEKVCLASDLCYDTLKEKLKFHNDIAKTVLAELKSKLELTNETVKREIAIIEDSEQVIRYCMDRYNEFYYSIYYTDNIEDFQDLSGNILFEGAQGLWLDEVVGTAPYNTWTNTTFFNALDLLRKFGYRGKVRKIGVLRTYLTRHGEGPFADTDLKLPEPYNADNGFQGKFRQGFLTEDWLKITNYMFPLGCKPTEIALNHLDCADAVGFTEELRQKIEKNIAPITIEGSGPTFLDREELQMVAADRPLPQKESTNETASAST